MFNAVCYSAFFVVVCTANDKNEFDKSESLALMRRCCCSFAGTWFTHHPEYNFKIKQDDYLL